ncbi:MAG: hypothetical protein ACOYB1_09990 [Limnohabitans sp.]
MMAPPHDSPFSKMATFTVAPVEDGPCQMPSAVLTATASPLPLPPPPHAASKEKVKAEMASLQIDVILTPLVFIWRSELEHAVQYFEAISYLKTINFYC